MKKTFTVLTAAFAMLAVVPRLSAQATNKMTVASAVRAPATTDTMPPSATPVIIALPESATLDTVKKIAVGSPGTELEFAL